MFNKENIHPKVQRALYRKIDAMNRLTLTDNRVTTVTGENGKEFVSGTIPNSNPFFIGNSLEPQDSSNPIEQHLYRGTFAKVSVAVPEYNSDESDIIRKPISISSYLTNEINEDNEIERINTPLTFREGIGEYGENGDNLFLGHSGITSIKVDQQNFYTYKYTINWVCPDPVYFEEVFEPSFLKFGAYVAMEFGWGINDSNFDTPSLSIEEMQRLLQEEGRLLKRNQDSAGNYHCGVGTVTMFSWKIQENGTYAGDIQVMTPGANTLLETTQGTSESSNAIPVRKLNNTIEIKRLAKEILVDLADKNEEDRNKFLNDAGVSEQQLINALQDTNETSNKLEENSIIFGLVMKNLSSVCDKYLEVIEPTGDFGFLGAGLENIQESFAQHLQRNAGVETNDNFKDDSDAYSDKFSANLRYAYRDGLMRIDMNPTKVKRSNQNADTSKDIPDFLKERHFATWGWFEDNILKSFFELTTSGGTKLQEIKSVTAKKQLKKAAQRTGTYGTATKGDILMGVDEPTYETIYTPNACVSTQYLYSLGLDHTILPGKHHPILEEGFDIIKPEQKFLIPQLYSNTQRIELDRIRLIYKAIDKEFSQFETKKAVMKDDDKETKDVDESLDVKTPGIGSIRNMVFPIEKFITHFENTPSLRQGLRNFWSDVSNQYGGYWGFDIGQDVVQPTRVGVFDTYYSEDSVTDKTSSPDDPGGRFKFSVLSDTSIVKSFDVDLQLTGEAATLARYGGFSKANRGTSRIDGKKDLGLEAWNILNSKKSHEDVLTLDQLERFKKIQPDVVKDLNYSSRTIDFKSISTIKEDSKKILEKVENERTQFLSGVGCYDKRGNFSQYFKQTMLYLINYSDLKGTGSNLEKLQVPLPVEVSLTLDGIGGLKVGDLFSVDYLPQLYRRHCYFMISNIGHSVTTAGWETTIAGKMMADMPDFYKRSGKKLGAGLEDYEELFRLTNIGEVDIKNLNAFQTAQKELDELESRKAYEKIRDNIDKLTDPQLRTVLSRFELTINYNQVKRLRPQLIKKWEKYLQVLEILGNTEQTTKENVRHTTFLDKLNLFLERNEEYEKTAVRRRIEEFTEDRPVAKAIFQSIKNSFKI
tara:strand:- start:67 stop:3360 length:3294 start_codon:yes stop_codon:yes gene_type:complete